MRHKLFELLKKDTVLTASAVLAIISAFLVPPSLKYIEYIDFRVLGILLSLMIVMAAFQENGFFDRVGKRLLKKTKNTRQLCTILIGLCFFFSMLITNDVALITFVPFTMLIFITCRQEELLIPVIVLQTIAANLGSMLTPVGNPQNLYLYNLGGFTLLEFIETMLPYSAISLVAIIVWMLMICRRNKKIEMGSELDVARVDRTIVQKNAVYTILFDLCLLVVLKVLPYYAVLILVVVVTFIMDREVLKKVDYSLIFTFTFFFIFTGNIGRLEIAHSWLQSIVSGRETIVGILVSQIISNVPATLLLSGFTDNYRDLLIGVNLGGLGTLIASMASLISYKIYAREFNENKGKYLVYFACANVMFLLTLGIAAIVI